MPSNTPIYTLYYRDYPLAFRLGSYLALFRPMAMAHMVDALYDTSCLTEQTFHRLQSTRLLVKQLIKFGTASDEGTRVIEHMNRAHAHVVANNDAYRYVLCCFFLEPFRWNATFDPHHLNNDQKQLIINFWCEVGRGMGITELLANENDWLAFQSAYESAYMKPSIKGEQLALKSLMETPRLVFPPCVSHWVRASLLATMEAKIRETLGLKKATLPASLLLSVLRPLNRLANTA